MLQPTADLMRKSQPREMADLHPIFPESEFCSTSPRLLGAAGLEFQIRKFCGYIPGTLWCQQLFSSIEDSPEVHFLQWLRCILPRLYLKHSPNLRLRKHISLMHRDFDPSKPYRLCLLDRITQAKQPFP